MHLTAAAKILGLFLMVFSLTMLVPAAIAWLYDEATIPAFLASCGLILATGGALWLPVRRRTLDLRARDGFLITTLFWVVLGIAGALPLVIAPPLHLPLADAVFESVSGFTTTGATVITGLDTLPRSILFYRQQLHFLGGIGIVVIAVAIMPMLGVGGMQLYKAENIGPSKESKMTPRIADTAKALFAIYVVLNIACALTYWILGMDTFDAVTHAFSTVSTGGFGNYDASMAIFDSRPIMAACIVFMTLAALSFGLHYFAWLKGSVNQYWRNPEARFFLIALAAGSLLVSAYLYLSGTHGLLDSLFHGSFQLVSISTSTGFLTDNFSIWPSFLPFFLMVMSFLGGCVGSTGGGVKAGRMLIMSNQVLREFARLVHPNGVFPMKTGNWAVPTRVSDSVWAFFGIYIAVFYAIVMLLMLTGLDYVTAWASTASMINNTGPGLGVTASHFRDVSATAKWLFSAAMILGRLEILTVLVLFTPMFWRR